MLDEIPIEDQYVFTSLRYDGSMKRNAQNPVCCPDSKAAYLIKYHYERLVTAADHLGWYDTNKRLKGPVDLFNRVQTAVNEHKKKTGNKCPFKVCVPSCSFLLSSPKVMPTPRAS
jgi:4-amino-4-deoxychorismate lyase